MSKLAVGAAMLLAPATAFAPAASATESSPGTIADIAISVSGDTTFDHNRWDYDILITALSTANLVDAVADPNADLTVFAPNDRAFYRLAVTLGYEGDYNETAVFGYIVEQLTVLGEGDPIPLLTEILLYHVSPEGKTLKQLRKAHEITTLQGGELDVRGRRVRDAAPGLTNPWIAKDRTNLVASNGVIQGITRVLIPLDI